MGTTIHFKGRLASPAALAAVEEAGLTFASDHGWQHTPVSGTNPSDGHKQGIVYFPHPDCEPLHLVFDSSLVLDDFVKTQFAGTSVHITVVRFLRFLAPHFSSFEVFDEGGYWDTSDATALQESMDSIDRRLADQLAAFPGSVAAIRESSGRITDLYRARTPEAVAAISAAFGPVAAPATEKGQPWWKRLFKRPAV